SAPASGPSVRSRSISRRRSGNASWNTARKPSTLSRPPTCAPGAVISASAAHGSASLSRSLNASMCLRITSLALGMCSPIVVGSGHPLRHLAHPVRTGVIALAQATHGLTALSPQAQTVANPVRGGTAMSVIMTLQLHGDPGRLETYAAENKELLARILDRAKQHGVIAHRFCGTDDGRIMVVDEWPDEQSF